MNDYQRKVILLDLESESDSDDAAEDELFWYLINSLKSEEEEQVEEEEEFESPEDSYIPQPKALGQSKLITELTDEIFDSNLELNPDFFTDLHEMLEVSIKAVGCNAKKPIDSDKKLAVFLRYLITGDSYKSIASYFKLGAVTVSNIVKEVANAIWTQMQPTYLPESTTRVWQSATTRFAQKCQFPHCVGALDGKHVIIKKSDSNIKKNSFSVVLFAIVDADYKFLTIDVSAVGRFRERNLFAKSTLGIKMQSHMLALPKPIRVPTIEHPLPYVFVGNESFPLAKNLMRPYPRRFAVKNHEQKVFNVRLHRARRPVECSFRVLASWFHVFRKPFECKLSSVKAIVKAACVLYNYFMSSVDVLDDNFDDIEPLSKKQLRPLRGSNIRNSLTSAVTREKFTGYFNNAGTVSWQDQAILQGLY